MNASQLARKTLEYYLEGKNFEPDENTKKLLGRKGASFVTLTKKGKLRGCIGSLIACRPLYRDIQENALNAAFSDSRFPKLQREELPEVEIEVSILSKMRRLEFKNPYELLERINNKMGIYLKKSFFSATFLPQVWEQLPDKVQFLEQLSMKAGLPKDAWKTAEIYYYTVRVIKE